MSIQIMADRYEDYAVLYCSTTDWAFGPVFSGQGDQTAQERADAFLRWMGSDDARLLDEADLQRRYADWQAQEPVQIARERLAVLRQDEEEGVLLDHEVPELAALRAREDLR